MEEEFKFIFYLVVALIWFFISQRRKLKQQQGNRPAGSPAAPYEQAPRQKPVINLPPKQFAVKKPVAPKPKPAPRYKEKVLETLKPLENEMTEKQLAASARKQLIDEAAKSFTNVHEAQPAAADPKSPANDFDLRKAVVFSELLRRPEY